MIDVLLRKSQLAWGVWLLFVTCAINYRLRTAVCYKTTRTLEAEGHNNENVYSADPTRTGRRGSRGRDLSLGRRQRGQSITRDFRRRLTSKNVAAKSASAITTCQTSEAPSYSAQQAVKNFPVTFYDDH